MNALLKRAHHATWLAKRYARFGARAIRTSGDRRLARAIRGAHVVSLDVFDTALVRCVPEPADVFELVATRLLRAGRIAVEPAAFRSLRIAAESEARCRARRSGRVEVTLDEIYGVLSETVAGLDVPDAVREELDVERAVCVANPDVQELYDRLQARGARIAFSSDSYLPRAFVAELLEACGYAGPHDLFVSNAESATKEDGTLFAVVARAAGVTPAKIVHLGDNVRPDVESARAAGVDAFWYVYRARAGGPISRELPLCEKVLRRLSALAADRPAPTWQERLLRQVAYDVTGPIFLGLVQWIVSEIRRDPPETVLFCARDGRFLHTVFERLSREKALPPARYFEVSRRALAFPTIREMDERNLHILCANNAPLPVAEFFTRLGIDITRYPAELERAGLRPDTEVYDDDSRERIRELFLLLSSVVLGAAQAEREILVAYLRQCGALDARDLVLVDIGWGGTLQQALADVLHDEHVAARLRAFYLSTDERVLQLRDAGIARAWFANGGLPVLMQQVISPGYWLLELAFAAQHGTILGYRRLADGTVEAVRHAYDDQSPNALTSRTIQAASTELIGRWLRIFGPDGAEIPMATAFAGFRRFVERPTQDEARFFGDMIHVGGLGTTTERVAIAAPPPWRDWATRPRVLVSAYRESHWQLAFVQRVFHSNAAARGFIALRETVRTVRGNVMRRLRLLRAPGLTTGS